MTKNITHTHDSYLVLAHYSEGPLFQRLWLERGLRLVGLGLGLVVLGLGLRLVGLESVGLWLVGLGLVDLQTSRPQSSYLCFNSHFPRKPGSLSNPLVSSSTFSGREPLRFFRSGCCSCHSANSVASTEGNSKHWSQPVAWPHPFFIYFYLVFVTGSQHWWYIDLSGSLPQCKILICYVVWFCFLWKINSSSSSTMELLKEGTLFHSHLLSDASIDWATVKLMSHCI